MNADRWGSASGGRLEVVAIAPGDAPRFRGTPNHRNVMGHRTGLSRRFFQHPRVCGQLEEREQSRQFLSSVFA